MQAIVDWPDTGAIKTANTARDGTGSVAEVFRAPQGADTWLEKIVLQSLGDCTASVARFFINNGNPNADATCNSFFAELSLPSTTATSTAATTNGSQVLTCQFYLPPKARILMTIGTTVVDGWKATAFAGDYWRQQAQV